MPIYWKLFYLFYYLDLGAAPWYKIQSKVSVLYASIGNIIIMCTIIRFHCKSAACVHGDQLFTNGINLREKVFV
jgi:hypothetical protein